MYLIRRAKIEDVPTLLKLARMVHFINLPADREIINEKVAWSRQCFLLAADQEVGTANRAQSPPSPQPGGVSTGLRGLTGHSPMFMFVMEELETQGIVGTSQIIARMGGPGQPNVSLQLSKRNKWSQSLQIGVTHTVAKLHLDESAPTEIGGLILQPSLRGHKLKLGRLLSVVRFHFMGLHHELFADRVLAELMGVISADGDNPFWDHCTRAFINLTFDQADRFCQHSKEFILALFPHEDIYLSLLPPEARSVVGQVGAETAPAKRMLENFGFKHHDRVDPFDAGPHIEAAMGEIAPIRATSRVRLADPAKSGATLKSAAIVSTLDDDGEFRAIQTECDLDRSGKLILPRAAMDVLVGKPGLEAGYTPMSAIENPKGAAAAVHGNGTSKGSDRKGKPRPARRSAAK